MTQKLKPVCATCGSDNVFADAWASWDVESQQWVFHTAFDDRHCEDCERECDVKEIPANQEPSQNAERNLAIEVYPMICDSEGNSSLFDKDDHKGQKPHYWDIAVNPYNSKSELMDDPVEEIEEIKTFEQAQTEVDRLAKKYPDAAIEWHTY